MAHNEIYTKFLIEYDKANVTSSYPSLTKYEIATILNKAYLALIAQKFTGNNVRQAPFEIDSKAISDLQPLITTTLLTKISRDTKYPTNCVVFNIPTDPKFLYYVSSRIQINEDQNTVTLVNHNDAQRFVETANNKPWIKNPVGYIEDGKFIVLYDNVKYQDDAQLQVTVGQSSFTYIKEPQKFTDTSVVNSTTPIPFELNDTMAEELISLAVLMALENVESSRTQIKSQMRGLEA